MVTGLAPIYARNATRDTDAHWYFAQRDLLAQHASDLGVSRECLTGIVAALSPQNAWDTPSGKLPNLECARKFILTGARVHTEANMAQARAILAGADPLDILTGDKRRAFYSNLLDPATSDAVTLDRWMARAIYKPSDNFTPNQYAAAAETFRELAGELSIRPHELQAAVWAQLRRES